MGYTTAPIVDAAQDYTCARDYQLFGPGPKRILTLDGGGVRGALTLAFLERIEAILSEHRGGSTPEGAGTSVRLGDYFDLIGGTSTGAIIAGALAIFARTHCRYYRNER